MTRRGGHAVVTNVRGVLYGAGYATLVTRTVNSIVIPGRDLAVHVPLAAARAIVSFAIGFFSTIGILLGPVLIGLPTAVLDTSTASGNWRLPGAGDDDAAPPLAGASAT